MSSTRKIADIRQRRESASAYDQYKKALARDPDSADLLGRQAAAALDLKKRREAIGLLEKSLVLHSDAGIYRRNLNLLVSVLFQDGNHDAARRALNASIPKWDGASAPERPSLGIILSLSKFLGLYRMFPEALELLQSVERYVGGDSAALEMLGALYLHVDQAQQAQDALAKAGAVGPDRPSLMMARAAAAYALRDFDRARAETVRYLNAAPVVLTAAKPSQTKLIGVANWKNQAITRYSTPEDVHFGSNTVGQMHEIHSDRYRLLSVFCESENALKALARAPKPDIVWNAAVNAELLMQRNAVDRISTLVGIWGAPTINHPENAVVTTRDAAERLYADIPYLLVPRTRRFQRTSDSADLAAEIEDTFEYPLIVRGLTEQQGGNAFKADNGAELRAAIQSVEGDKYFYVIRFCENRTERGLYRKIRAAVAGDFIQIVRVDFDEQWNVHGRKSQERAAWYLSRPELLDEEAAICEDADRFLGLPIADTLKALRQRVPLDVFGIDFDVTKDGQILLFEANAAMNLLSTAAPGVEHPRSAESRFVTHLDDFIDRLAARA